MLNHTAHACVFDAYGTLFDVHSATRQLESRLGEYADEVSTIWRQKQLEYTWLRSLMGEYADFERIVNDSLEYALKHAGIDNAGLRDDLLQAYRQLDCFPEVPATLKALKDNGLGIAILSNGTRNMVESCIEHTGLGNAIDVVLSVDSVRIYKPAPRVYELAVDHYGPPVPGICFQSSNAWDIAGAAHFGFTCVWINRNNTIPEILPGQAAHVLPDLTQLPGLVTD